MSTLLHQIEAVLNSRPLYQQSDGVGGDTVLTPAHFLIGRSLLSVPELIPDCRIGNLDRWRFLQKLRMDFWKKWKEEYLVTLQQCNKWQKTQENYKGQIVIVRNELTHPAKWPMGKIEEIHSGTDGKLRVVSIKTKDGYIKRPIVKICPLRIEENISEVESENEHMSHITTA
ncbi:uncharacterized protein LOC119688546 [Teleopsis dalmanni]|uniref:uncharacterized protein LOC119688546 n=1 Tax=Teleopsis dalmanni TaxID=139649 RepID=UPI0018CD2B2C|nr:uncharacterized protein LOC119688546 [Teleopsis dalmanni]